MLVGTTVLDAAAQPEHLVTVVARDPDGAQATIDVTIEVSATPVSPPVITTVITGPGGGGGGGPSGPTPSEIEFEWNVTRDIEELDGSHDVPAGSWSDGTSLWIAENGSGADDAVYAYDIESGERVEDREFELDETNRAPRGIWSDRTTIWISDSGQDKLFAHDLASGERLPDSDLALHPDNDDARGIWSDGSTMWVLDGRDNAVFGYDLASGELLAEYALDSANDDPRGIWSDGVSVWVSDHIDKRLFAYRLPSLDAQEDTSTEEDLELERVTDEEFDKLPRVSNNSPRGLWSDGDVMYVADESDGRVYSYNMPDAIDARLASLTLSGVDIGEFSGSQTEYEGVPADGVTETTVEASAAQSSATVAIDPADSDEVADGDQAAVAGGIEITVTVTSADESRTKVYRVRFGGGVRGAVHGGLPARRRHRRLQPARLRGRERRGPRDLRAEPQRHGTLRAARGRVPALHPRRAGLRERGIRRALPRRPPRAHAADRQERGAALGGRRPPVATCTEFGPDCLRGEIATGFSLVLYEGGSVEDLDSCAQGRDVSAVYALVDGEYVPYILGAPEFVNEAFVALFPRASPRSLRSSPRVTDFPQRPITTSRK